MRRPAPRVARVAALAAIACSASRAAAQVDTVVEVRGCDAGDALVAAIRVELAAVTTPIGKVTAVCLPESRVLVVALPSASGAASGAPTAREVDVADVPEDARTRSVAIAAGELFRSLASGSAPPPLHPPLPPPGPGPAPSPPTPTSAPRSPIVVQIAAPAPTSTPRTTDREPHAWAVGGAMRARTYPANDTTLVGPAVEVDLRLGASPLRLRLATDLAFADGNGASGDASIAAWTGAIAFMLHARSGALVFDAGPFVEGGAAFVAGTARSPGAATEGSGTRPLALVGGQAIVGARFDAILPYAAIDAGGALAGIEAKVDTEAVLTIAGPFVGLRLGLAVAP